MPTAETPRSAGGTESVHTVWAGSLRAMPAGGLVGFVNVVSDGGDHAFLIDTKTHGAHQRKGVGTRTVHFAAQHAKAAGCEWLHVDFEADLAPFYFDACGFRPTDAGLIHLPSLGD